MTNNYDDYEEITNPDDIYGTSDLDPIEVQKTLAKQASQKISHVEVPEFEEYTENQKTMELKFIDGRLHQLVIVYKNIMEVLTGNTQIVSREEIWQEVASEVSADTNE